MRRPEGKARWDTGEGEWLEGDSPEEVARDAGSIVRRAKRERQGLKGKATGIAVVVAAVAGFIGFQWGEGRAWSLAEIRAARVYLAGACEGVTSGVGQVTSAVMGPYYNTDPGMLWDELSLDLAKVAWEGQGNIENIPGGLDGVSTPFELEERMQGALYSALTGEVRAARVLGWLDSIREDPALEGLTEIPENWEACDILKLEPDGIRDGSRYEPSQFDEYVPEPPAGY